MTTIIIESSILASSESDEVGEIVIFQFITGPMSVAFENASSRDENGGRVFVEDNLRDFFGWRGVYAANRLQCECRHPELDPIHSMQPMEPDALARAAPLAISMGKLNGAHLRLSYDYFAGPIPERGAIITPHRGVGATPIVTSNDECRPRSSPLEHLSKATCRAEVRHLVLN
ncbi:hypothetical protein [Novosphingobium sp. 11B]